MYVKGKSQQTVGEGGSQGRGEMEGGGKAQGRGETKGEGEVQERGETKGEREAQGGREMEGEGERGGESMETEAAVVTKGERGRKGETLGNENNRSSSQCDSVDLVDRTSGE